MKLIRELHETIKEDSKLIIFCDNKILYDQAENTYSFAIKDLNLSDYWKMSFQEHSVPATRPEFPES